MSLNPGSKKTNILLIKLPPWEANFPPQGIAYLSAYLEKEDIDVKILDLNLEVYKGVIPEIKEAWKNNDCFYWQTDKMMTEFERAISWMVNRILSFDTQVIGFSLTVSSCKLFNAIITSLKKI